MLLSSLRVIPPKLHELQARYRRQCDGKIEFRDRDSAVPAAITMSRPASVPRVAPCPADSIAGGLDWRQLRSEQLNPADAHANSWARTEKQNRRSG